MNFNREEKAMWIEDWRRSGKKAWAYAKDNGLVPQTFCSWVKRADEKKSAGFIEVPKQLIQPVTESRHIIIETGAIKIHIPLNICASELQTVFSAIGRFT